MGAVLDLFSQELRRAGEGAEEKSTRSEEKKQNRDSIIARSALG
jgi:hypothetical protein